MTTVYFVRHAESDNSVKDDVSRPLTENGRRGTHLVASYFKDIKPDKIFSSPYKRAADTVSVLAAKKDLSIEYIADFRERNVGKWVEDFDSFAKMQWSDFSYCLEGGESLNQVQARSTKALCSLLDSNRDKTIIVGTHGTVLCCLMNHFDHYHNYDDFKAVSHVMPFAVRLCFDGQNCVFMEQIDLTGELVPVSRFKVDIQDLNTYKAYRFVVIFARYKDKWLYCRAKSRDTYETAGGHIENGETPLEAARRELFEETGAADYSIIPAFDYRVTTGSEFSGGQVFFAEIHSLGEMPNFEMAETKLFDSIPDKMRFPNILPIIYKKCTHFLRMHNYTF